MNGLRRKGCSVSSLFTSMDIPSSTRCAHGHRQSTPFGGPKGVFYQVQRIPSLADSPKTIFACKRRAIQWTREYNIRIYIKSTRTMKVCRNKFASIFGAMQLINSSINWTSLMNFRYSTWIALLFHTLIVFGYPPTQRITCLGDHYPIALPKILNLDPNTLTMQQLCVGDKEGNNVQLDYYSLDGWCLMGRGEVDIRRGRVVFDKVVTNVSPVFQTPRLLLGCQYRCFCSYGIQDVSIQPRQSTQWFNNVVHAPSQQTYQVAIDVVDDFQIPSRYHVGPTYEQGGSLAANAVNYYIMNQAYFNAGDTLLGWFPVVLDQRNYIECRGDLPQFPLPPPYQMSDFDNLQQLCAVQWAGGKS